MAILRLMSEECVADISMLRHELFEKGPEFERETGDFERVSLPSIDCDVLCNLVHDSGATRAIEIGLAYGASALAIAEGLAKTSPTRDHLIIDPFQELFEDVGWRLLLRAGLEDNAQLIRAKSQLALPELLASSHTAEIAFVDGSHFFHNVLLDLVYLEQLVVGGGLVVLDDCQHSPVAKAAAYFIANRGWVEESLSTPDSRLKVFRLPPQPHDARFDEFIDF